MILPASRSRRALLLVSLASLGWAFSFGLGAPLASLVLKDAGCSARTIGLNTSLYYLGVAVAAPMGDPHAVVAIQVFQRRSKEAVLPSPEL